MENRMTPEPVEKTPEQIEAEMFETRESLTEKVAALESQVVGTVQTAANTLTETVDAVKEFVTTAPEAVSETVEQVASAVKEQVRRTFDVSERVQSNPWACVAASVGVGFAASYLLSGARTPSFSSRAKPSPSPMGSMPLSPHPLASSREPGLFDDLFNALGRKVREKVKEVSETAIDAAANALNRNVREQLPRFVEEAARRFTHVPSEPPDSRFDPSTRV